jgi:hypothetical protein
MLLLCIIVVVDPLLLSPRATVISLFTSLFLVWVGGPSSSLEDQSQVFASPVFLFLSSSRVRVAGQVQVSTPQKRDDASKNLCSSDYPVLTS